MASSENSHHDQSQSPKGSHSPYNRTLFTDTGLIRLFLLQPSSCYESDIHGKLREISLIEQMEKKTASDERFEALSYTWGIEQSCNKLTIDGISIPMKSNLETFLRRRREVDRVVPLWIDALCINQEDHEEKSQQIPIMNTIYTACENLTIWLGPADTDSDLAMKYLYDLGCASPYDQMPVLPRQILESFRHLLSRPWWSRVWIIQEVVMGGLWNRLDKVNVMCGEKEIGWMNLVIGAARLWSHHAERRQYFPNLQAILDLDRLRNDSMGPLISISRSSPAPGKTVPLESQWAISLVAEYRHFQATDARDKVYALANMFSFYPRQSITPDYTTTSSAVYAEFARWALQNCSGLEVLRHCGTRKLDVPSWVPDWSVPQNYFPLPSKNRSRLRGAPWWSQPIVDKGDDAATNPSGDKGSRVRFIQESPLKDLENDTARRRLEIGAKGTGFIKNFDEIPQNFVCAKFTHNLPSELKAIIPELIEQNLVAWKVSNSDPPAKNTSSSRFMHWGGDDALQKHEMTTARQMHDQLSRELQDPQYQAAGATHQNFHMDKQSLVVEGVVWDEIESVHCGFVSNIDANFEDATRFMVALGQCKAMAEDSHCATRRLPDLEERLKSFWLCILAGRPGISDLRPPMTLLERMALNEGPVAEYMTWLPPIPSTWNIGTAPVTATTSGLLELAERTQRLQTALSRTSEITPVTRQYYSGDSYGFSELIPSEWTLVEHEIYKRKFKRLGMLWSEQKFDLYHTPFEFLNVVPDPYWDTRKDHDERARQKTQEYFSDMELAIISDETNMEGTFIDETRQESKVFSEEMTRQWNSHTSRISKGTLGVGFEKYALGRKFFVTKKGYFGLVSKEAQQGDRIAVLLGSDVPFVLRACGRVDGKRNWQMIGETYVDGIMNSEVLNQVDLGNAQPSMLRIS